MPNRYYRPQPEGTELKKSPIEGHGMFAKRDFKLDDIIGVTHYQTPDIKGLLRSGFGAYINYSGTPNCQLFATKQGDSTIWKAKAKTNIKAGEELTLKYRNYNPEK